MKHVLIMLPIIYLAYIGGLLVADVGEIMCEEPYVFTAWIAIKTSLIFSGVALIGWFGGRRYQEYLESK